MTANGGATYSSQFRVFTDDVSLSDDDFVPDSEDDEMEVISIRKPKTKKKKLVVHQQPKVVINHEESLLAKKLELQKAINDSLNSIAIHVQPRRRVKPLKDVSNRKTSPLKKTVHVNTRVDPLKVKGRVAKTAKQQGKMNNLQFPFDDAKIDQITIAQEKIPVKPKPHKIRSLPSDKAVIIPQREAVSTPEGSSRKKLRIKKRNPHRSSSISPNTTLLSGDISMIMPKEVSPIFNLSKPTRLSLIPIPKLGVKGVLDEGTPTPSSPPRSMKRTMISGSDMSSKDMDVSGDTMLNMGGILPKATSTPTETTLTKPINNLNSRKAEVEVIDDSMELDCEIGVLNLTAEINKVSESIHRRKMEELGDIERNTKTVQWEEPIELKKLTPKTRKKPNKVTKKKILQPTRVSRPRAAKKSTQLQLKGILTVKNSSIMSQKKQVSKYETFLTKCGDSSDPLNILA